MAAVGNHESHQNFSHYTNRFAMPNKAVSDNHFYSWDAGLVHFVAYNTETCKDLDTAIHPNRTSW